MPRAQARAASTKAKAEESTAKLSQLGKVIMLLVVSMASEMKAPLAEPMRSSGHRRVVQCTCGMYKDSPHANWRQRPQFTEHQQRHRHAAGGNHERKSGCMTNWMQRMIGSSAPRPAEWAGQENQRGERRSKQCQYQLVPYCHSRTLPQNHPRPVHQYQDGRRRPSSRQQDQPCRTRRRGDQQRC